MTYDDGVTGDTMKLISQEGAKQLRAATMMLDAIPTAQFSENQLLYP